MDHTRLYEMAKQGYSAEQILEVNPNYLRCIKAVETAIETFGNQKIKKELRKDLKVYFIWGETGIGKTRSLYERYGSNMFRITSYKHPFDNYKQEEVLVFEEFRGQLSIDIMLNLLDIYPCEMDARYKNAWMGSKIIYLVSNDEFHTLYPDASYKTLQAFKRRFTKIGHFWDYYSLYEPLISKEQLLLPAPKSEVIEKKQLTLQIEEENISWGELTSTKG